MKNSVILTIAICLYSFVLQAQTPESVVREYVRLLNDWLANPYDADKEKKVADILTFGNKKCTMADEIVERYNSDSGDEFCSRDTYLSILRKNNPKGLNHLEILGFINSHKGLNKDVVTVRLKYSGNISLETISEFWIFDNKIRHIDFGGEEKIVEKERIVERIIEKEKIVEVESSDENTGKAYLTLHISEPNADVYVDGQPQKISGRVFRTNLPYGSHTISVSKPAFKTERFFVRLDKEPVEKIVTLQNAYVVIHVEREYDAYLFVDGVSYGTIQSHISVAANQKHTIRIEKNGHCKSKKVKAYQNNFTVVMPKFSDTQVAQSNWFIGCSLSPKLMSAGISVGKCKKMGFILNGGFSKLAFTNWNDRNTEKGGLLDTFKIGNVRSTSLLENKQLLNAQSKGLYRSYIHFGPMFRIFDFMYMYAALGCGTYADVKSYEEQLYAPTIHNGMEGEAGLMLKFRRMALSFGYTQNIGKKQLFSDYHLGVNCWMKVLKNKLYPKQRFIVGYKLSPNAQFGMSLGVSFGYHEKWGLIVNGGFSKFALHTWKIGGYDYYPFYNYGGGYIGDFRPASVLEQSQWESANNKGIFRSYYHIGPFFRINDVFAYYIVMGYGNYAHVRQYNRDVYAAKIHNGVDGEVGFMLKFGRIGFSLGYQSNIGKSVLFQDINVGVQLWLGR